MAMKTWGYLVAIEAEMKPNKDDLKIALIDMFDMKLTQVHDISLEELGEISCYEENGEPVDK